MLLFSGNNNNNKYLKFDEFRQFKLKNDLLFEKRKKLENKQVQNDYIAQSLKYSFNIKFGGREKGKL